MSHVTGKIFKTTQLKHRKNKLMRFWTNLSQISLPGAVTKRQVHVFSRDTRWCHTEQVLIQISLQRWCPGLPSIVDGRSVETISPCPF